MEIKTGEASIELQMSSEIASESDISIEKRVESKKKKKEIQGSENVTCLHYYTAILHNKPLNLKKDGVLVQEQQQKHLVQDLRTRQYDMPDSSMVLNHKGTKVIAPLVQGLHTADVGAPKPATIVTAAAASGDEQLRSASFFNQLNGKAPEITDVAVLDKSYSRMFLPKGNLCLLCVQCMTSPCNMMFLALSVMSK
ncbi:MAG: hypothetical protein ACMZI0_17855 [Symbiopectobacterium sp.]|uniref:hypothetical protein n=1 Tax=Symbiopectobacterium sp. TaxID=2952789 RepID=UPI0039E8E826